jgi:glycerophosphoryl diester phosphodiesterase
VKISHHRAASRYAPENTIPAIENSLRLHVDYIELDIRTTSDGRFYLLHDSTLNRTTNGQGKISEATSGTIEKLDAGSWFGKPFSGVGPPTFDSALALLPGKAGLYADAKDIDPAALIAALEKHQLIEHTFVYQGADYLRRLKQLNSKVGLLPPLKRPDDLQALADTLKPHGVDAAWGILSKELIDRCHALGILVFSDALGFHENVKDYLKAMEAGIDVIQTDHPARVLRAIELSQGK